MPKDNEVDEKVMPVAWQWLDTSNFRKSIPSAAIREHWNPLYSAATVAELRAEVERLRQAYYDTEQMWLAERDRADSAERRVGELRELCGDMLKVFEAARPLVLNLERLRDAVALTGADPT